MRAYGALRYGHMTDRASFERNRPPDAVRRRSTMQCHTCIATGSLFSGSFFYGKKGDGYR